MQKWKIYYIIETKSSTELRKQMNKKGTKNKNIINYLVFWLSVAYRSTPIGALEFLFIALILFDCSSTHLFKQEQGIFCFAKIHRELINFNNPINTT